MICDKYDQKKYKQVVRVKNKYQDLKKDSEKYKKKCSKLEMARSDLRLDVGIEKWVVCDGIRV